MSTCPPENSLLTDQSTFWSSTGPNWDKHRIGWAVAGGCAWITLLISAISVMQHCRNYTKPREQRQVLRILYMPPVYAIIAFFSYRFFREYTYYSLVQTMYEAVTLSAFLFLIIEYVASTASDHNPENAVARRDKRPLPFPFCFLRYRPTKPYFMYTKMWIVDLQYTIIGPLGSIAGIICERYGVLCGSAGFNIHFASVWIQAIEFVSISVALYGLFVFYGLILAELEGKRPMFKFAAIKLIVMFTFYQSFLFQTLASHNVLKGTEYWPGTPRNVANGLNALAICVEMVFFSGFMWWAYTSKEYQRKPGMSATRIWRPLWDSINFSDFGREIVESLNVDYCCGKPSTRSRLMEEG
ncbi:hypothetical protein M378DRAFT_84054 [Amanita muscaria Koide BX008]|uniref:DUF300-domain-containing protein n=1 Tax=Amanita muscaria (strain Koide BX008) TaxID=946122 RepID=A0A0C2WV67_AMAMK|nr:hypothetical protein M378DRAFT_84054 [Amanita muscaria Koide BX008]